MATRKDTNEATDSTQRSENAGAPDETRLDDFTDKPSTNAPGDAPHDTTKVSERATSAPITNLSEESLNAGTVNAVVPLPDGAMGTRPAGVDNLQVRTDPNTGERLDDRIEEYDARRPDGKQVHVVHNIDTGETKSTLAG